MRKAIALLGMGCICVATVAVALVGRACIAVSRCTNAALAWLCSSMLRLGAWSGVVTVEHLAAPPARDAHAREPLFFFQRGPLVKQ